MTSVLASVGGRTFASVRKHRNYRLYFTGQAVSFTGTWMQQIAASWLVLQLTHSAIAVGALALAQLLPVTLFFVWRLAASRELMGEYANGPVFNLVAGLTVVATSALSLLLLGVTFAS